MMDYQKVKEQIFSNICPVCGSNELLVKEISIIGSNGIILCESCESVFERKDRIYNIWELTESNRAQKNITLPKNQWKSISESPKTLSEVDTDQFEAPDSSSTLLGIGVGIVAILLAIFIIFSAPSSIGSWVIAFFIALVGYLVLDFLQPSEPDLPVDNQSQNTEQNRENKYCPDCGFENPTSNNYCNDCGVKLQ
jgi:hypothetical protein